MSAPKKKRMGSQRRSLNQNLQESPETSGTAKSPPVPQGRQRAETRADLTPGSAQSEIPVKKKLSSKRASREKLQFKDVTAESSHKPLEEVENTTYSQDPDFLGIKNESFDESLVPGSGQADFDLLLDKSSTVSTSTIIEAVSSMPQTSDILDINMETRSDLLLIDGQNKKSLPKIATTQEGVLTEKDLAQQMPDILEATLPAGVTGESACSVRLIEQEDINITGSHDHKELNTEENEAGHIEKPVCQQSDESSRPTPKARKLGSSRRKKDTSTKELQDQGHEKAVESNIAANVLEKTDFTIVQNTQEVTIDTPPDDIYRDQADMDDSSVGSRNLLEVKNTDEAQVRELLADFKDQEVEQTKPSACEKVVGPQDFSAMSSIEISPIDDTIAPQSVPHSHITVSVGEAKNLEIGDCSAQLVLEETDKPTENITIEDYLTLSGVAATSKGDTYSKDNTFDHDLFASEEKKEITETEFEDVSLVSSCLSSEIPSELERETSSNTECIIAKDKSVSEFGEPMFGVQIGMQSPKEELLHFNQNYSSDLVDFFASPKLEDKNEMHAAQTEDVCQVTTPSVSVTDEDKDKCSVDPTNIKDNISDYKNVDLIDQPLETLNPFTDGVSTVPGQIYKGENLGEDIKLSDEAQILNKDDIFVPPNTSLVDVCDEADKYITAEGLLKTETRTAQVQESTLKSNTYPKENVNIDLFDTDPGNKQREKKSFKEETIEISGSEAYGMLFHTKDEAVTVPIGEKPGIHATTTENKEFNILNVTTRSEFDVSQPDDVYQMASSSVNVTHEGVDALGETTDKLLFSTTNSKENGREESGSANNVVLLEQQPEPLISFTLGTDPGQEAQEEIIKLADEQIILPQSDKSSEPLEPQIQQTDETDASLTSSNPDVTAHETVAQSQLIENRRKLGSSRRIKGRRQINDEPKPEEKSGEIITPIIVTEETQIGSILHEQGRKGATDNEEHEDKVDKGLSQLVYDEPHATVEETHKEASENLLQVNKKEEIPHPEPSSLDVLKYGQSGDNKPKKYLEEEKLPLPNKEDLPKVTDDRETQPTELNKPTDNINAPLPSPHPDFSVDGSSLKTQEQRQDNTESKQKAIDMEVDSATEKQSKEITADNYIVVEHTTGKEFDKSFIQVHDEALETVVTTNKHLNPTEVTAVSEKEQTVENNASKDRNTLPNVTDNVTENVVSEVDSLFRKDSPTDLLNTEQSEIKTGIYLLKDPINVHQLTYLSDNENETHEENSFLQQTEQSVQRETIGEPLEVVPLVDVTEVNAPNADLLHGPRRKLGSSRRTKARKPELAPANDEPSNDSKDIDKVTELVQSTPTDLPQQALNNPNFALEIEAEITNKDDTTPKDAKDTVFLLSDKEQTVNSEFQGKSISEEIQKEVTALDSSTIKDKVVAEAGSTSDADILQDSTRGGSEETVKAKIEDTIQSVVIFAEDMPKHQQEVQVMEVLAITAEQQINREPKRRKMGSTRRPQLDRKQQDENRHMEDNAAISDSASAINEKEIIATVNEDAENVSSDIFVKQEEISVAAVSPVKQPNGDSAERQKVAQGDKKEEVLQTGEVALIEGMNTGATTQNLQPVTSEGIQPSSPGKRRKLGSTRKNLTSKKESQPEDIVTPVNVGKEALSSISNKNIESKEQSGFLIHAASVHQQPPDEKTPLSQQDNQEKLEESSHPDLMTEEAVIARRRKMGSHRKPNTDQKDSDESLLHPTEKERAESPKQGQISEVNERDVKAFSTASALNIKRDLRPEGQKILQPSQVSTNVHRAQQSNIRLASGYDPRSRKYEVVMIGDSSVGKTSFIQRAQSGGFSQDVPASIGMDSYKWTVVVDGQTVVLHLWDTAGQERFHSMTKQIFHRAQAFLLMYDITCAQTFTAVSYWANCIKEAAGENVVTLLLGNKSDSKERKVGREDGELLAQENDFAFIECSAATGENVTEALETVARLLSQKTARREEPLELRKPEPRNKGCC